MAKVLMIKRGSQNYSPDQFCYVGTEGDRSLIQSHIFVEKNLVLLKYVKCLGCSLTLVTHRWGEYIDGVIMASLDEKLRDLTEKLARYGYYRDEDPWGLDNKDDWIHPDEAIAQIKQAFADAGWGEPAPIFTYHSIVDGKNGVCSYCNHCYFCRHEKDCRLADSEFIEVPTAPPSDICTSPLHKSLSSNPEFRKYMVEWAKKAAGIEE